MMRDDLSFDEWRERLAGQLLALGFLNKVFYDPPESEFIETIRDGDLLAEWPMPGTNEDTAGGLRRLRLYCAEWTPTALPQLTRDYNALFIGPGHVLAPPWESVYLGQEGLLFEEPTFAVRRFYERYGLQASRFNVEPDDHFGLELAFLAHLCALGLSDVKSGDGRALADNLQTQREFLENHLQRWAPEFLDRVESQAATLYFQGAARLARGTLNQLTSDLALNP